MLTSIARGIFILLQISLVGFSLNSHATTTNNKKLDPKIPKVGSTSQPTKVSENYTNLKDFFLKTHVDGNIRSYYFTREFGNKALPNQSAFSLGGKLNVLTAPFGPGFRVGGTLYTTQSLGLNSANPSRVDKTLPGSPLTTLGQAFLQYQNKYTLVRLGDQVITTPWLNEADSRMIPATYRGIYMTFTPVKDWDLNVMRQYKLKGRINRLFTATNLYNNSDHLGSPIAGLNGTSTLGTLAFGTQFKRDALNIQGWAYKFYDYANLLYGETAYIVPVQTFFKPLIKIQAIREWSDGKDFIGGTGMGSVNSTAYGLMLGAKSPKGQIAIAYNEVIKKTGGFNNGGIVSPYTTNYISDPLYTTSMIAGLIEKAAGHAIKILASYSCFDDQWLFAGSYAKYYTAPFTPNTTEGDFDVTYLPPGKFKNFSIRNRIGILNGSPTFKRFVYNRVMLQYSFS